MAHIHQPLLILHDLLHGRLERDSLEISHLPHHVFRTMTGDLNSPIMCNIVPSHHGLHLMLLCGTCIATPLAKEAFVVHL